MGNVAKMDGWTLTQALGQGCKTNMKALLATWAPKNLKLNSPHLMFGIPDGRVTPRVYNSIRGHKVCLK